MSKKYALLSVFNKTGIETVAERLIKLGFDILSSGGTATYLKERNIPVTDVAEVTSYAPVLGHRVVTLAPQIHGGLLATEEMESELEELGWPRILFLLVSFYPLKDELDREGSTFESCLEKTDIGGPAMARSAVKGGEVIVLANASKHLVEKTLVWMEHGSTEWERTMRFLRWVAEENVAKYVETSATVHTIFKSTNPKFSGPPPGF